MLIKGLRIKNLLSFGPDAETLPLENLNVLIGANGAGKSNLIEALALMRTTQVAVFTLHPGRFLRLG